MRNLNTVFRFEFHELIRKKAMIISTSLIAIALFIATFTPRLMNFFAKDEGEALAETGEQIFYDDVLIVSEDEDLLVYVESLFKSYKGIEFSDNENEARIHIEEGTYDTAFIMSSETSYTVLKKDMNLKFSDQIFESVLYEATVAKNLEEMGIDLALVAEAENIQFDVNYETLGKDSEGSFAFGMGIVLALYILILMYGQLVATSVAREKDSRTMELLITSTNPKTLIVGKVLAAGFASLLQVLIIAVVILIGFMINKSTYPSFILEMISGNLSYDVILVYLVFSFSGYLLYLFIYAALGSLVSKVEDVGSAVASITLIFVGAYLIATMSMADPNATIARASSFIPFVSLFTMPIRYMMTSIPLIELSVSLLLMIAVIVLIAYLSIYIYRMGSLNYGNRMKLRKVIWNLVRKK